MIKVLSKGKRYQIECEVCNSMLEYGIEDITVEDCNEIYFEAERSVVKSFLIKYLKCPVCGHYIPEGELEPFQKGDSHD